MWSFTGGHPLESVVADIVKERDAALARAEAAEDDLRELRENTLLALGLNPVDVTAGMEDQSIAYLLGGLKQRVAELEARLAEQGWRPVDDLDLDRGSDVDILARGHYDPEMGGVMLDSRDFLLSDGEDFIAWRPRTTSPIDPPAPA